jgi:hypothetical protein
VNDVSWAPGERRRIATLGAAVLGAMLYPVLQNLRPRKEQVDSFPLSYFPMFRQLRKQTVRIIHVVGTDVAGDRHYMPTEILVEDGINTTRHQLNRTVREGRATEYAAALSEKVASAPALRHIVRVDIVRGVFDLDACLLDGPSQVRPTEIIEIASAPVADRPQPPAVEDIENVGDQLDSGNNSEVGS